MAVAAPGGVKWAELAALHFSACGRSTSGAAYCWGFPGYVGASDPPPSDAAAAAPLAVSVAAPAPQRYSALGTGSTAPFALAVAPDTTLYGWGARRARGSALTFAPARSRRRRPPSLGFPHACARLARPPRPAGSQEMSSTTSWATASPRSGASTLRSRPCARACSTPSAAPRCSWRAGRHALAVSIARARSCSGSPPILSIKLATASLACEIGSQADREQSRTPLMPICELSLDPFLRRARELL